MQKKLRNHFEWPSARLRSAAWGTLAVVLAINAYAQSVIFTPPPIPAEPKSSETTNTGDTNQVDSTGGATSVSAASGLMNRNPFQWGPIILHPRIGYGLSYGTGLPSQRGQASDSAINTVSAGFGMNLGKHWDLGYSAGASFYSDPKFKNNVDHNVTLHGNTSYEDWKFNLSQSVAITSDPLVQTSQQTDQQSYSTSLAVGYQISGDLSAALTAGQQLSSTSSFTNAVGSTTDWSLSGSLNYQLAPSLSAGLGAGWGYSKVAIGPDNTYEDVSLNLSWAFARKLSLSVNGGAQIRQFIGSGQSSLISPTFGVTLNYHPFRFTTIYLSASRSIGASFFQSQVNINTAVNVGLSQRLFKKYSISLNGSYGLTDYQNSSTDTPPQITGRSDTQTSFSVSVNRSFLKRGTASVFYSKSQNSSNSQGYHLNSNQAGLSLGYSY